MRILYLTRWAPYPPLNAGDIVYTRNLIENLADLAKVYVLVFEAAGVSPPDRANVVWEQIPYNQAGKIASLVSHLPNVANRHNVPAYIDAVKARAQEADAVIVDHLGLAWCVPLLRSVFPRGKGPPLILVNHNHEASLRRDLVKAGANPAIRGAMALDGWKASRLERTANAAADGFTVITTSDQRLFAQDVPGVPSLLLMPGYAGPRIEERTMTEAVPRRICILGGRGPLHKQIVLTRTLDALAAAGLERRYTIDIVGNLGGADKFAKRYPGFHFRGFVDDLAAYMADVRLGLIPDQFGGGFKVRALSHIFLRTPMLALSQALKGMGLRDDVDFISAENLDDLVAKVPDTIEDLARLDAVQNAAFAACDGRFSWAVQARSLHAFAQRLIADRDAEALPVSKIA